MLLGLLGIMEFLKANWIWIPVGVIIIVCIVILLCTDGKDKKKKDKDGEAASGAEPAKQVSEVSEGESETAAEEYRRESEPAPQDSPAEYAEPAQSVTEAKQAEPEPAEELSHVSYSDEEKLAEAFAEVEVEEQEVHVDEEDHGDVVVKHSAPSSASKPAAKYRVCYDRETFTWVVKKDNNTRVTRRVKTKKEALEVAKELCKKGDATVTVHKKDGKFQKKQ